MFCQPLHAVEGTDYSHQSLVAVLRPGTGCVCGTPELKSSCSSSLPLSLPAAPCGLHCWGHLMQKSNLAVTSMSTAGTLFKTSLSVWYCANIHSRLYAKTQGLSLQTFLSSLDFKGNCLLICYCVFLNISEKLWWILKCIMFKRKNTTLISHLFSILTGYFCTGPFALFKQVEYTLKLVFLFLLWIK